MRGELIVYAILTALLSLMSVPYALCALSLSCGAGFAMAVALPLLLLSFALWSSDIIILMMRARKRENAKSVFHSVFWITFIVIVVTYVLVFIWLSQVGVQP